MSLRKKAVQSSGLTQDNYYSASTSSRRSKTPERVRGNHVSWKDSATIEPRDDDEAYAKQTENSSSPTSVLESNDGRSPPSFSPVRSAPQSGTEVHMQHRSARNGVSDAFPDSTDMMDGPQSQHESVSASSNAGVLAAFTNAMFPSGDRRPSIESRGFQERNDANVAVDQNNRLNLPAEVLKTIDIQRERTIPTRQRASNTSSEDYSSLGSESELGSMSMEFDAVLAAAVAAGVRNSSGGGEINDERSTPRLAGIEEESNTHGHFTNAHETLPDADEGDLRGRGISEHHHVPGSSSTVMTLNGPPARLMNLQEIDTVGRDTNDRRINREEPGQHSETSILAPSSRAHSSSRREQQSENVPLQSLSSSRRVENSDSMLARSSIDSRRGETGTRSIARTSESALQDRSAANVGAIVPWMGDPSVEQAPISSSGNNTGQEKPPPKRVTLARIRREKLLAKASAWQEAITSKIDNRYKREESKIYAWEDHQKAKASIILKEAEMKLEQKRARAVEKMQNEIARVHKKAENQKAAAYAKRQEKVAKVVEEAEIIKKSGRVPRYRFSTHDMHLVFLIRFVALIRYQVFSRPAKISVQRATLTLCSCGFVDTRADPILGMRMARMKQTARLHPRGVPMQ